jgi:hypothetical protein
MQSGNFQHSFIAQRMKLERELWNLSRSNFTCTSNLSVLRCNLLETVCDTVWDMHLLKTSILITRTPLTTLKCLYHKYLSHSMINLAKERISEPLKMQLGDDLSYGLKQLFHALHEHLLI